MRSGKPQQVGNLFPIGEILSRPLLQHRTESIPERFIVLRLLAGHFG